MLYNYPHLIMWHTFILHPIFSKGVKYFQYKEKLIVTAIKNDKRYKRYDDVLPKQGGTTCGSNKRIILSSTILCPLENATVEDSAAGE